jgi:hypothetical protein
MTTTNTNTASTTTTPTITHKTPKVDTPAQAQKGLHTTTGIRAGFPTLK